MDLKDILAISGHGSLFRFVSQGRNGIIVENLKDEKRMIAGASAKISSLEDIAIYTFEEDKPLSEVYDAIYKRENGGKAISHKSSNEELKAYLKEVLPEYDDERVYVSDIKKLVNWYNQLHELDLLRITEAEETNEDAQELTEETSAEETNSNE